MPRYFMAALNGPKPDWSEADYNDWYDRQRLKIKSVPGVIDARRYKVVGAKGISQPYVVAYDIEADDIGAFMQLLGERLHPLVPPFDQTRSASVLAIVPESADRPPLLDHLLLAFNGPVDAASEAEYARWYDEEHIPEVLQIGGIRAMERCRVINGRGIAQAFVLVHRIDTDDVPAFMQAMAGTGAAPAAMDRANSAFLLASSVGDYSAPEGLGATA